MIIVLLRGKALILTSHVFCLAKIHLILLWASWGIFFAFQKRVVILETIFGFPQFGADQRKKFWLMCVIEFWRKSKGVKNLSFILQGRRSLSRRWLYLFLLFLWVVSFFLPIKLCDEINAAISNFWWGENEDGGNKIHWINWQKVSLPKSDWGMGFIDLHYFNPALLAKQSWRIRVKIRKGIYFHNSDFLNARKGRRPSWGWSSILAGRDLLKKGLLTLIQNREDTNIWRSKSIPDLPSHQLNYSPSEEDSLPLKVAELIDHDLGIWELYKIEHVISLTWRRKCN